MSKQAKPTEVAVLDSKARSAVVAAYVDAIDAKENVGGLLNTVCETARRIMKGQPFTKPDADRIVVEVSKARGWKGKTAKSRESETRIILRSYAQLPEALKAVRTKAGSCTWHHAMKAARKLAKGESLKTAVAFALAAGTGNGGTVQGRCASALKAWYAQARGKRADILKAAKILGLELRV